VAKARRGFAVMDREKQREIASKGGRAAHEKGTAHRWSEEEAKEAGRKGGAASHRNGHRTSARSKAEGDEARQEEPKLEEPGPNDRKPEESQSEEMRNGG
jgi:uncharacterized protein